jgi:catechol 2,3-dioxygenase-like lactoylglutathione lyase family enzyme
MITVKRLNHAVMWVGDAQRSYEFYRDILGFELVRARGTQAIFLRANGSDNDHDIGLFTIGMDAPPPTFGKQVGLYHLAWEVESLPDLARARVALLAAMFSALCGLSRDKGARGCAWGEAARRGE